MELLDYLSLNGMALTCHIEGSMVTAYEHICEYCNVQNVINSCYVLNFALARRLGLESNLQLPAISMNGLNQIELAILSVEPSLGILS
jgi:hypothetical protein